MKIQVLSDAGAVSRAGADYIAAAANTAVEERGIFTLALSGGRSPQMMLEELARRDLPWSRVEVLQADERIAPDGSPDRNLEIVKRTLVAYAPLPPENLHAMPVGESDLEAAAAKYQRTLETLAGSPPVLDLVHLGLGADGHTASLVPGDPILEVADRWVGITDFYQQYRRMTLTYPVINGARAILFVITGKEKAQALRRLSNSDATIPAGRVADGDVVVLADRAASSLVDL